MKRLLFLFSYSVLMTVVPMSGQSNGSMSTWMEHMAPYIEKRAITEIFIPASHGSATYQLEYNVGKGQDIPKALDPFSGKIGLGQILEKWSKAQGESVLAQLEDGVRFLDLRIIYRDSKKQFYTVHSLYGPSVHDILSQIARFVNSNPKEIIVIQVGDFRYMPHNDKNHHDLIRHFQEMFGDKLVTKSLGLATPITTLWQQKKQVIIIYNNNAIADQYDTIFSEASIDSYWPNKDSVSELKKSLFNRLPSRRVHTNQLYVIQAQLTPVNDTIAKSFVPFIKSFTSLRDMADAVHKELPVLLPEWAKYGPSVIMLDFVNKNTSESIIHLNKAFPKEESKEQEPLQEPQEQVIEEQKASQQDNA